MEVCPGGAEAFEMYSQETSSGGGIIVDPQYFDEGGTGALKDAPYLTETYPIIDYGWGLRVYVCDV